MGGGQPIMMGAPENPTQVREDVRANATANQTWEARGSPGGFDFGAVMAAAVTEMEVATWRNAIPRDGSWLVIKDL